MGRNDDDEIREAIIRRVDKLGLTAYAIAKASNGKLTQKHVREYLIRESSMTSARLQHLLPIIGMEVRTKAKK